MQKKLTTKSPVETEEVAIVESHETLPADLIVMPELGVITGEITRADIELPYIKIIQGIGESSLTYPEGSIVLNKQILTQTPRPGEYSDPIYVTVLKGKKLYREVIDWKRKPDAATMQVKTAETRAEAESWGIDYTEELRCLLLVRASTPEMKQRFDLEGPSGEKYTIAMGYFAGVAWGCGKSIIAAAASTLSKGSYLWEWAFKIRKEIYGKGPCYVPKINLSSEHNQEFIDWIKGLSL